MQASSGNSQEAASASQSAGLVEHFFRHEWSNLVAVLTRAFGIARIDLIEDTVQAAMLEAMHAWKHRGVPTHPSGWIHRVARNRILDALRREKVHARAMALSGQTEEASAELLDRWFEEEELPDSLLRMMFVCCHPSLDQKSQIALSLSVLCGFHVREIASGLLLRPEAVKKRIQRAKAELAEAQIVMELPSSAEIRSRLAHVHDVLYLLFNEGYSTSHGVEPIRDDICEEAARLCHLLCHCEPTNTPATRALLALMLFHGARLDARLDEAGNVVLLEDQDRSKWDRKLIQIAAGWLAKSMANRPSRASCEGKISPKQMRCLRRISETSPDPGSLELALQASVSVEPDVLKLACSVVKRAPLDSRRCFLKLAFDVATVDRRLSTTANYILRFLIDLTGIDFAEACQLFGTKLPRPADVSSVVWWAAKSRFKDAKSQSSARTKSQKRSSRSSNSSTRKSRVSPAEAFAILDLEPDASDAEIVKAYRRKASLHHPDRHAAADAAVQKREARNFALSREAFEVLRDHR